MVAPEPRRPPPGLEDALHATPPVSESNDGLSDVICISRRERTLHDAGSQSLSFTLAVRSSFVTGAALAAHSAVAQTVTGGVDPTTGLTTLSSWIFGLVGIAIPTICAFKGAHAVAEGRHLAPYVGIAIGGLGSRAWQPLSAATLRGGLMSGRDGENRPYGTIWRLARRGRRSSAASTFRSGLFCQLPGCRSSSRR